MSNIVMPGDACDCKGRPIYPGDLLKSYHFTDRRRRKHWLYHVAVYQRGSMEAVPVCHLQPGMEKEGGRHWIRHDNSGGFEIIHGFGPEFGMSYKERPRCAALQAAKGNDK